MRTRPKSERKLWFLGQVGRYWKKRMNIENGEYTREEAEVTLRELKGDYYVQKEGTGRAAKYRITRLGENYVGDKEIEADV